MRKFIWAAGALGLAAAFTATPVKACTTVVVGKKATTDGSTLVARNEDVGAWSKNKKIKLAMQEARSITPRLLAPTIRPTPSTTGQECGMGKES